MSKDVLLLSRLLMLKKGIFEFEDVRVYWYGCRVGEVIGDSTSLQ